MPAYPLLYLLGLTLLLSGCWGPETLPKDIRYQRENIAKQADIGGNCRLLALREDFFEKKALCEHFEKRDEHCESFPERKPGCYDFLSEHKYESRKTSCRIFIKQMDNCVNFVEDRPFYYKMAEAFALPLELWWQGLKYSLSFTPGTGEMAWYKRILYIQDDIHIAVLWSGYGGKGFLQGVELAMNELNQEKSVLGRKLIWTVYDDEKSVSQTQKIAWDLGRQTDVVAVIGRQPSSTAIPASIIYHYGGMLYLSLSATNVMLTRHNFDKLFSLIPNNEAMALQMVKFALDRQQNYKRVVILHARDPYNEELAFAFRDHGLKNEMEFPFQRSFFARKKNFQDIIFDLRQQKYDAIFLAAAAETATHFVKQVRKIDKNVPILGGDALDSLDFLAATDQDSDNVFVPTVYSEDESFKKNRGFVNNYRREYGMTPDTWAAQGYDSVYLLAYAINRAKSTVPAEVSASLRYMPYWLGVTGLHHFAVDGYVKEKKFYFKQAKNGEFDMLPSLYKSIKLREIEVKHKYHVKLDVEEQAYIDGLKTKQKTEALADKTPDKTH